MNSITSFCILDDLCKLLNFHHKGRKNSLSISEIAHISLLKSQYNIRTWKGLYKLLKQHTDYKLPSYKNFITSMNVYAYLVLMLINILIQLKRTTSTKIKIIDSTPLPVCKKYNMHRHKTMKTLSTLAKGTTGWFYGLKLHILIDNKANILMFRITTGKYGDRKILNEFLEEIEDSIILADAGYVSNDLERKAAKKGNLLLVRKWDKRMKTLTTQENIELLKQRKKVEAVFSVLKEKLSIVSSLPRSIEGYLANYIHVLFAYTFTHFIS